MKLLTRPRFWQREMIPMGPLFVTRPALHAWLLFGNAGKKDLYFVNILDPLVVATRPMRQCHSKLQSKVCFHRQLARTSPPLYKIVQLRFGMTPPNHPMAGFPFSPNQHQANSANCRKRSSTGILDPNHINGLGAMVHHAVFHTESLQMEPAWLLDSVGNPNCDPTQTATLNHPT